MDGISWERISKQATEPKPCGWIYSENGRLFVFDNGAMLDLRHGHACQAAGDGFIARSTDRHNWQMVERGSRIMNWEESP